MGKVQELDLMVWQEMYTNGARAEAFATAWLHREDLAPLVEELQEREERLDDPDRQTGSHAPNTSVRLYSEGYVAGLKDALSILNTSYNTGSVQSNGSGEATADGLAPLFYRGILEATARSEAFRLAYKHENDLHTIEDWVSKVEGSSPDIFLVKLTELVVETTMGERPTDIDMLRSSIPFKDSLSIYRQAYLSALKQITEAAHELGIETEIVSTEAQC